MQDIFIGMLWHDGYCHAFLLCIRRSDYTFALLVCEIIRLLLSSLILPTTACFLRENCLDRITVIELS